MSTTPRPPLHGLAQIDGMDETAWLDVIEKMEEVYSQLVQDEIALEEKNAQLEQSQQFIFSLLTAMSDVLVACNAQGIIEETNAALFELVGLASRGEGFTAFAYSPTGALHAYRTGDRLADGSITSVESTDVVLETDDGPLRVLLSPLPR